MPDCVSGKKRSTTAASDSLRGPAAEGKAAGHRRAPLHGCLAFLCSLLLAAIAVSAQEPSHTRPARRPPSLSGVVTDPSGAVVPGAVVTLTPIHAPQPVAQYTSSRLGRYRLTAGPGTYTLAVEAPGFARYESGPILIGGPAAPPGPPIALDITLKLATLVEQIDVPIGLAGDGDGNTIVLGTRDVERMPLDPVALLNELQAMAGGPSAELYVSGFSGGKLPPRDSIGLVRIRRNPYSADNDIDPGTGIIQVSPKVGAQQTHGELYLFGDDSALNARNPFLPNQPGYYADGEGGSVSGSLRHKLNYFAAVDEMALQMNSAVDAQTLDANLNQTQVSYAVASPRSSLTASSRLDFHPAANSTSMVRYAVDREAQTNGGVGQLALASQGFANTTVTQTLQLSNTQLLGPRVVNETRFQYIRARAAQSPVSSDPAIVVEGAFLGGGNDLGAFSDHQDRYELQNYLSVAAGNHYLELGGRLRVWREANHSLANYSGEFIFATLAAYQATGQGVATHQSFAQIQAAGGGASQFSLNAGNPSAAVAIEDSALFAQDDWKLRPNLTLSYGLRFETQTYIANHADWAPRVGFSWTIGHGAKAAKAAPNYVLHGGAGIFYRRFTPVSALTVERQNGVTQQEYIVASPQFCPGIAGTTGPTGCPGIPPTSQLAALNGTSTIYRLSPRFHAPYYIGASLALDRRLGRYGTLSVSYLNNRGVHTQLTENVNAPLPGTYSPSVPTSGVRPNSAAGNIYQFTSAGVYRSNRLTTNLTLRASRFNIFGYYMLRFDKSDADGDNSFPANQYSLGADYGRALSDSRHTATVGENGTLPLGIQTSAFISALSGAPFNIVVGQDLNGDSQFNDRPAFATDLTRASVVRTRYGSFDTAPAAGQTIIPRNYGQGPGLLVVNLAVGRSFAVGPEVEGPPAPAAKTASRKYAVELWVESQNLLNHPNLTPPIGTLNSPLFGRSVGVTGGSSLSPGRVVDLQLSFRF